MSKMLVRVCADYKRVPPKLQCRTSYHLEGSGFNVIVQDGMIKYDHNTPDYRVVKVQSPKSSGTYRHKRKLIIITAGYSYMDAKLVFLHEIAHHLHGKKGHTRKFWETAFELYAKYGVPQWYAEQRESSYKKMAEKVVAERRLKE